MPAYIVDPVSVDELEASARLSGIPEIERELRSQYLLAYSSDRPTPDGVYRVVEVKVKVSGSDAAVTRIASAPCWTVAKRSAASTATYRWMKSQWEWK